MKEDLVLTATGMAAIVMGEDRYPLCMTIAGMKEWAEHEGRSFDELLKEGWVSTDLDAEGIKVLLWIALKGGEARRSLFSGDERRGITMELAEAIMDAFHPTELMRLLIRLWNEPPAREPDPQTKAEPSPLGG
ncbi:MAG: hypothetical protein JW990_20920 [Thermoleophilia bacterium]|nr:hypothetical protein [Thermoleophilia bacterium]